MSTVGFPIAARFAHPGNGYKGDQAQAARHLTPGRVYMVRRLDVGSSSSVLYLDGPGLDGIGFNTVLFEGAAAPNDWDDLDAPEDGHAPQVERRQPSETQDLGDEAAVNATCADGDDRCCGEA